MKKFLFNYIGLLYFEFIFGLLIYSSYLRSNIINIMLFLLPISLINTLLTSIGKDKLNKIINYIIYSILGIWFSLEFVFKRIFNIFFSMSMFELSDQALKFKGEALKLILQNSYGIIIFFIPLILLIVFRKKYQLYQANLKKYIIIFVFLILSVFIFMFNIKIQKNTSYSIYELYYKINDNALNIEKLGVLDGSILDIYRSIFGFNESIKDTKKVEEKSEDIFTYDYNNSNIDFSKLTSNNNTINIINNYMKNNSGTKKNRYTGIFKKMNLIYITAESFSTIGVDEKITPTLYKLVNNGFTFNNFYTSHSLSTIGGEFQSLTGLYANNSILKTFREGTNSFPYGLANMFKKENYNTYAYHNHYYNFQDRNKYLKSMGFDNYKGCYSGLEKVMNCNNWPNSDIEMIDSTINDYINSDKPFLTYYMTVSGHFEYTKGGNSMVLKNWALVENLPYSTKVKGYLATQIELDKALELLISKLDEKGILDNTVIVMLADHYPYDLSISEMNELSNYQRDENIEVDHNSLVIWNNNLNKIDVNKVSMSIDVIPTVYNLFGLDYDSRLFVGNDIFSTENGLAIFNNRSWVTNYGTYFANNGKTIIKDNKMTSDYINNTNSIVNNRMNISKYIIETDYYKYILNNN